MEASHVKFLKGRPLNLTIVFFQMGKGRTTIGMIVACLVKDVVFGQNAGKEYPFKQVCNNNPYESN